MRSITIRYQYEGPEENWREMVDAFITALDADPDVAGKFEYQVAVGDDGKSRVHWGRWDTPETLRTMQSRDYFKQFSTRLRELAGGPPETFSADVALKTSAW